MIPENEISDGQMGGESNCYLPFFRGHQHQLNICKRISVGFNRANYGSMQRVLLHPEESDQAS